MARFITYLNESSIDEAREDINKLCKPYIKNVRKMIRSDDERFLLSGRKNTAFDIIKGTVRQNRRPTDTPLEIHELLDSQFNKEFGIKARSNTLFCTLKKRTAKVYGVAYYIFPIGNYTTIWSNKVDDLFEWLKSYIGEYTARGRNPDYIDGDDIMDRWRTVDNKVDILDLIEDMNIPSKYYTDKSYDKMKRNSDNEIMLYCKDYIGLSHAFIYSKFNNSIWEFIDG